MRTESLDYERMSALILALPDPTVGLAGVASTMGCHKSTVSRRRDKLFPRPGRTREYVSSKEPVNALGWARYDYRAAVARDLRKLHADDFSHIEYAEFLACLNTRAGQRYLREKQG